MILLHREDRGWYPVYVLALGHRPLKLQAPLRWTEEGCSWQPSNTGLMRRECHNLTLDEFARQLPGLGGAGIDRLIVEQTCLMGGY